MGKDRQMKSQCQCCAYDLKAEQLYRNWELQKIKSYGDGVTLEDGTVLYRKKYNGELSFETNERTLCRCRKCGALFLDDYHFESDMYDPWSSENWYPVTSEEEADLINILMDGKDTSLPDFRRPDRYDWNYKWIGKEAPGPLDAEELKDMIRKKYAAMNLKLLENLIRRAGQEKKAEKTPLPEPDPEPENDEGETEKEYRYMANWGLEPPALIRLGSSSKMEADMYVYPGVWKDTPYLNDIRAGLSRCLDYDDISEKETGEIMEKWQAYFDRIQSRHHD